MSFDSLNETNAAPIHFILTKSSHTVSSQGFTGKNTLKGLNKNGTWEIFKMSDLFSCEFNICTSELNFKLENKIMGTYIFHI